MEILRSFYHPDHLGSTSWITDRNGDAIQYLHYLPFGEEWIDQRSTSWNAQYSFTGKIKDAETGYNYFGARYYDSGLSVWLSVDPLSDKYPTLSPYTYCANNPIMMVDPDGRRIDVSVLYTLNKNGSYKYGFVIKAFQFFASTKLGYAELAKYAEADQTVFGVTFKKDGEFHKEGVDLFIGGDPKTYGASVSVTHKIENGRLQLTVGFSNIDNVASCLGTICHEMFIHCFQDSKDFIYNGELDFSYANKKLKKEAKDRNRYDANYIHHNQDERYWGRLTVYGISILYDYHNKKNSKTKLWETAKAYKH